MHPMDLSNISSLDSPKLNFSFQYPSETIDKMWDNFFKPGIPFKEAYKEYFAGDKQKLLNCAAEDAFINLTRAFVGIALYQGFSYLYSQSPMAANLTIALVLLAASTKTEWFSKSFFDNIVVRYIIGEVKYYDHPGSKKSQ